MSLDAWRETVIIIQAIFEPVSMLSRPEKYSTPLVSVERGLKCLIFHPVKALHLPVMQWR